MLISGTIPNLVNGISEQPDTLRLPSQAESQINFWSSVANGLTRRPPSRYLCEITNGGGGSIFAGTSSPSYQAGSSVTDGSSTWTDAFLHTINRDTSERYLLVIRNGQVRVFDTETGEEKAVNEKAADGTITSGNAAAYLSGASAGDLKAVTVADYTFIVNKAVKVAKAADLLPARPMQKMVSLKGVNYARGYGIRINGYLRSGCNTPAGDDSDHAAVTATDRVMQTLFNRLTQPAWDNSGGLLGSFTQEGSAEEFADFTYDQWGNSILITNTSGEDFSLTFSDGDGNENGVAIGESLQEFSDLPKSCAPGYQVEIVGSPEGDEDNYYLKFESSSYTGVWREIPKWGEQYLLDPETMPHQLVREADGTFTLSAVEWTGRDAGDDETNPFPSFVDRKINDIFFFRNRLGFLADENVVMSEAGSFFNFFRKTVTTLLDDDVVDLATTASRVSILKHAIPFDEKLLIFSDQTQFILDGGSILTPSSASVQQATSYEIDPNVNPVNCGQYVYFVEPKGKRSGMREYYVRTDTAQNDANDVTSHCPNYLPEGITKVVASPAANSLAVLSESERNSIWVYNFFFSGEGRLQSAWSKWEFSESDTILSIEFLKGELYMVVQRWAKVYINKLSLTSGTYDGDLSFQVRADQGILGSLCNPVYADGVTTWTTPYTMEGDLWAVVIEEGDRPLTTAVPFSRPSQIGRILTARGDWTGQEIIIGMKYESRYEFSKQYIRETSGGSTVSKTSGRLQLRYFSVTYDDSGYFQMQVSPPGRAAATKTFTGKLLGTASTTLGTYALSSGTFRAPVQCRNIDAKVELISNHFLPCSFTSAEWEGLYNTRARAV